jgi:isopentenyl-diphosphate delta-isomerase
MIKEENVILVNEEDEITGVLEKMEAHRKGLLHRAFSIFIFNSRGEMLLQQRALSKYHSGGLWSNTCCGHPLPGEPTLLAAQRRLKEEMGFDTPLEKIFDLVYRATLNNDLTEHEFDHVFTGCCDAVVLLNNSEVKDFCFREIEDIKNSMRSSPQHYTAWFHLIFPKVEQWLKQKK